MNIAISLAVELCMKESAQGSTTTILIYAAKR